MTLQIHGKQCDLGNALKEHADETLRALDEKYFGLGVNATVTFSKTEHKGFRANIVNHVGHKIFQADATGRNAHIALSNAADKLAKQLRRTKTRVRDDHHNREKRRVNTHLIDDTPVLA